MVGFGVLTFSKGDQGYARTCPLDGAVVVKTTNLDSLTNEGVVYLYKRESFIVPPGVGRGGKMRPAMQADRKFGVWGLGFRV